MPTGNAISIITMSSSMPLFMAVGFNVQHLLFYGQYKAILDLSQGNLNEKLIQCNFFMY